MRFLSGDEAPDLDYEFISDPKEHLAKLIDPDKYSELLENAECTFCEMKDQPLTGPFCKFEKDEKSGQNKSIIGEPLWFHAQCIERNNFSSFD